MKKIYFTFLTLFCFQGFTQNAVDCAVQVNAVVQTSTPQITLNWIGNASTTNYTIYRKLKTANTWGTSLATLSGTVNQYIDNSVNAGVSYEYKIQRTGSGYTGYGYINSGITIPSIDYRGKLILVIDSTMTSPLASEITRLVDDLEGDGWDVVRHDVLRTGTVTHVKSIIVNDYNLDPVNTKALFILGHVPVPYSGNLNPDGHPDHQGAWPTDMYYADVNGNWTDVSVTSTTASPPRTQNVPGDGKFDQSITPTPVELQTGRVDLSNLTSFTLTETQLLKNYLDKDHDYRKKIYIPIKQGIVDDNFGYMSGEAFAASGYNNMSALVGTSSVTAADYFTSMSGASYQWSYGCGGGTYTSASGIGATSNFAASNLDGVFTMLFGSYFGDWDIQDNFLRAPLAQGKTLTNVWSGRPHWAFHHMALGENIGYGVKLTQTYQGSLYFPNIYNIQGSWIHNNLMGDPTLRNDIVSPVSNVIATKNGVVCNVSWSASTQTNVLGYNIYMKNPVNTSYTKINPSLVTGTTYTDNCLIYAGIYKYMVRAVVLETSPCGTYYNLSEGIADTAMNTNPPPPVIAQFTGAQNANTVTCVNSSSNATTYYWTFGDGVTSTNQAPVHTYSASGLYTITLIASNMCYSDTTTFVVGITITSIANNLKENAGLELYPNPAIKIVNVRCSKAWEQPCSIIIYNTEGKAVYIQKEVKEETPIDISSLPKGVYLVKIDNNTGKTLVIE
ncbi:MAG: T9SS type A sorting domain-containing protein [Bacteroidia bacterium]